MGCYLLFKPLLNSHIPWHLDRLKNNHFKVYRVSAAVLCRSQMWFFFLSGSCLMWPQSYLMVSDPFFFFFKVLLICFLEFRCHFNTLSNYVTANTGAIKGVDVCAVTPWVSHTTNWRVCLRIGMRGDRGNQLYYYIQCCHLNDQKFFFFA